MRNQLNKTQMTHELEKIIEEFIYSVNSKLNDNLIGIYLFGSLTYGDFNHGSSDIDLVVITKKPLSQQELEFAKQIHDEHGKKFPAWRERLECSYTPIDMFNNLLPPKEPRPYFGGGVFYEEAPYGNEWIINNYLLHEHGIALTGPELKTLIKPIDIVEVQKACIRDLFQEWEPKITDDEWLRNPHYQSYLILNLCRILYTVIKGKTASKNISAQWVINHYGKQWSHLIEVALSWKYGMSMTLKNETINFIKFTIDAIKKTTFYSKYNSMADYTKLELSSERIKLIPISMEYAAELCEHFTPEITKYMWPSSPKTLDEIKNYILVRRKLMVESEDLSFIIINKSTGEFLGHATLDGIKLRTPELGLWLKKQAQGRSIGCDAINLIKVWAEANLEYDYLKYPVHKENIASIRVAEMNGGIIGDEYVKMNESGHPLDEYEYRIYKIK